MRITGQIIDKDSQQPIQGASITVRYPNGNSTGVGTTTGADGMFSLNHNLVTQPNVLGVTHISYEPFNYDLMAEDDAGVIEMDKKVTELDPVIVKPNLNYIVPFALALVAAKASAGNRRVGALGPASGRTETLILVAGAGILFLGFDTIKKMLEGIGFWDSKETKNVQAEINNPNSPFSPKFYQAAPAGSLLLTAATAQNFLNTLTDSFGAFDDDEAQAIGVFKQMKTQSQVSFFSDYFTKNLWPPGADLLTWLRGTAYPNDRLDDDEIDSIISYVNKLPKYKI